MLRTVNFSSCRKIINKGRELKRYTKSTENHLLIRTKYIVAGFTFIFHLKIPKTPLSFWRELKYSTNNSYYLFPTSTPQLVITETFPNKFNPDKISTKLVMRSRCRRSMCIPVSDPSSEPEKISYVDPLKTISC